MFQFPVVINGDTDSIDPSDESAVHLRLESPTGGQEMISYSFAEVPNAAIRCDDTGYLNFHVKTGGIGYTFHSKLDNTDPIFTIRPTVVYSVKDFNAQKKIFLGGEAGPEFTLWTRLSEPSHDHYELVASVGGSDTVLLSVAI